MVLHNNKWDRKQNRDRIRKLKAKGKDDTAAAAVTASRKEEREKGRTRTGTQVEEGESTDTDSEEVEEVQAEGVGSNAWRYEDEELELPGDVSVEEPEEDYVALTLSRKGGQIKDPEEEAINTGAIDKEFLDESWAPKGVHNTKGKLVKVDKREFIDVNEKIAKQNTVDAFRARFQSSKTKARAPRTVSAGTSGRGGEEDDLDAFLGELALDDGATGIRDTEDSSLVNRDGSRMTRGTPGDVGGDDEWLDQMLGGR